MRIVKVALLMQCVIVFLMIGTTMAFAADPGLPYPAESEVSDQKAGSVLFFNVYTSSTSNPATQNTQLSLTNTSSTSAAFVHLFWIANNCSTADNFVCLTAQQTMSAQAFDLDPGITGFVVAVAVDGVLGCPISFNHLIGDSYVKFSDGFFGSLGAEAISALYTGLSTQCNASSDTTLLLFTGAPFYNRIPRVIAISSLGSRADGYFHRVFINSTNGDLRFSAGGTGALFGLLYDESEQSFSFTLPGACQLSGVLGNANFPRTTPRFEQVIPANSTGWMKIWTTTTNAVNNGIFGVVFTQNANAATDPNAFNGARSFHKLTLGSGSFVIPVFPPTC